MTHWVRWTSWSTALDWAFIQPWKTVILMSGKEWLMSTVRYSLSSMVIIVLCIFMNDEKTFLICFVRNFIRVLWIVLALCCRACWQERKVTSLTSRQMLVERYQYLSVFFFWICELFFIFLFPFLAFRFASKFLCFLLSCSLFLFSPSFLFFSLSCFLFFLPSCQHKFSSFSTLVYKTKRDAISSFCLNIQQFTLALWFPAKFLKNKTKDHR